MNFRKIIKTLAISTLCIIGAQTATAQDLLARQAPVDRKANKADSIRAIRLIEKEELSGIGLSDDLYTNWENGYAHYKGSSIPETYKIDLRGFHMPTPSRVITSNFGPRWGRQHKGLDIKVYIGDTIRAAFSGKVRVVRYEAAGYGKYVVIRHSNGLETYYAHMSKQLVSVNQMVKAGDPIGLGGNTGRSTGSHLHFETRLCGVAINPALLFDFRKQDVTGDFYTYRRSTYNSESAEATRKRGKVGNGSYTPSQVHGDAAPQVASESSKPAKAPANENLQYHKVASGETLQSIAQKYGVSVERICYLNHMNKDAKPRVGQLLRYS